MCVLVVEDNELIRLILVDELIDAEFPVAEASTADDALLRLGELDPPLSLLITDIHMPGTAAGIALARHVAEHYPGTPVIFTKGHPGALEAFGTLSSGQLLIRKPYTPRTLIEHAAQVLPGSDTEAVRASG